MNALILSQIHVANVLALNSLAVLHKVYLILLLFFRYIR